MDHEFKTTYFRAHDGYLVEHCARCGKSRERQVAVQHSAAPTPAPIVADPQDPRAAAILDIEPL